MKILVPVKRVIDAYVKPRVKSDQSGVELTNVKMDINPFCEIAVEEAVRMKEKGEAAEVVVVSIGGAKCEEILRKALAIGADRAVLVETAGEDVEPLVVAKILKNLVEKESADLVILGKQSIDGDNNQTGQMLAALLGWGQGAFASEVKKDGDMLQVTREVDGGLETLSLKMPAVVTTDLRLNEPRYVKLPNIMQAKRKPLDKIPAADFGVDLAPRVAVLKVTEPPQRSGGELLEGPAAEIVQQMMDKIGNRIAG
ncbi:MAG: electron transfer flavoprotein subunit beta/FixA family protein [Micavibrio sp.]|nr:MAG: electron transfer flavoprotein subunit beta/FixA family protein [Micavibrio sp.]